MHHSRTCTNTKAQYLILHQSTLHMTTPRLIRHVMETLHPKRLRHVHAFSTPHEFWAAVTRPALPIQISGITKGWRMPIINSAGRGMGLIWEHREGPHFEGSASGASRSRTPGSWWPCACQPRASHGSSPQADVPEHASRARHTDPN